MAAEAGLHLRVRAWRSPPRLAWSSDIDIADAWQAEGPGDWAGQPNREGPRLESVTDAGLKAASTSGSWERPWSIRSNSNATTTTRYL